MNDVDSPYLLFGECGNDSLHGTSKFLLVRSVKNYVRNVKGELRRYV